MNQCAKCGRFDSWNKLEYHSVMFTADIYGGIGEDTWFEHKRECHKKSRGKQK